MIPLTINTVIGLSRDGCVNYHLGDIEDKEILKQILDDHKFREVFDTPYDMRPVYSTLENQIKEIDKVVSNINVSECDSKTIDILNEISTILKNGT